MGADYIELKPSGIFRRYSFSNIVAKTCRNSIHWPVLANETVDNCPGFVNALNECWSELNLGVVSGYGDNFLYSKIIVVHHYSLHFSGITGDM